jgi:hypothetical protein
VNDVPVVPITIRVTAIMSNITPRLKKTNTTVLTILKRMSDMAPIPYESKERVIINAPTNDRIFIKK